MLGFVGQYRFITPLCEGLVSSGLDSIKKLATIHAKKEKEKKSLMSVNTRALQCLIPGYCMYSVIPCQMSKQSMACCNDTNRDREEIALTGTKLK